MTTSLHLRLLPDDARAFDTAAEIIAGSSGAPYLGRTEIIRRALAAFNAQHGQPQQETGQ